MKVNTPLQLPFAKNPLQNDSLHDAIAAALLQFDESLHMTREQPTQGERPQIARPDSTG
jgi:hypothetical protein